MAKKKARKLRKKTVNVATLSINARKTAAGYGLASLGARGWDGKDPLLDSSDVISNPRMGRKEGTEIHR